MCYCSSKLHKNHKFVVYFSTYTYIHFAKTTKCSMGTVTSTILSYCSSYSANCSSNRIKPNCFSGIIKTLRRSFMQTKWKTKELVRNFIWGKRYYQLMIANNKKLINIKVYQGASQNCIPQ